MSFSIAIDGPAGAGKSTVADLVAAKLGILHLDTGAMYRALALKVIREGGSTRDEKVLGEMCRKSLPDVRFEDGVQHTLIDGEDVTSLIRTPEVGKAASDISAFAAVRAAMVECQQNIAKTRDIIMDGRDIGTVVLPNATLKVFLTASPEVRCERRFRELKAKGIETSYEEVLQDVLARDKQDTTRSVTPLRKAEDAVLLDTGFRTQLQLCDHIVRMLRFRQGKGQEPEEKIGPVYRLFRGMLNVLYHTVFPVRFHNQEQALLSAPYILIANHQSATDPVMAGFPMSYMYQVRFMGKKELAVSRIGHWFFVKKLKIITVDRRNTDMASIRASLNALKDGHVLGVFPEGTRHKQGIMEQMENGTALIALMSNAVILPCYVESSPHLFRTAHAYYGQPLSVADIAKNGTNASSLQEVNRRIQEEYRKLVANAAQDASM